MAQLQNVLCFFRNHPAFGIGAVDDFAVTIPSAATEVVVLYEGRQSNSVNGCLWRDAGECTVRQMKHECKMQQEAIAFQQKMEKTVLN